MKSIEMVKSGNIKVVSCPWYQTVFEPVPNCTNCRKMASVDYARNEVLCKYGDEGRKGDVKK